MTNEEKFIDMLSQNIGGKAERLPALVSGVVQSVGDQVCSVELVSELVIEDVRFKATEEYSDGWAVVPKEGTDCLIGFIGGDKNRPYLMAMDEVDFIRLKIEGELFKMDAEGFDLAMSAGKLNAANSSASLREILEAIVSMVEQITVSTGMGASGTPLPPTIQAATDVKNSIQSLFK